MIEVYGNQCEAWVWLRIAILLGARAISPGHRPTAVGVSSIAVLVAFGLSDLVEARTGAWWRPWWLLVWKASCLAALSLLAYAHFRNRVSSEQGGGKGRE
jgi:hypothetical protein